MTQNEVQIKQERFLFLCDAVFGRNEHGKELLATLKESLVDRLPVADPDKSENHAFYREGQNSLIRSFAANIEGYAKIMKDNAKKTAEANE